MQLANNSIILKETNKHATQPIALNPHIRRFFDYFSLESGFNYQQDPQKSTDVYRLRHKVYCETLGYEPVNATEQEQDEFDLRSDYISIVHDTSNETVGCTRIINCHENSDCLPVELLSCQKLYEGALHPGNFPRQHICEISRLTVDKAFHPIKDRNLTGISLEQSTYPYINLHLYLSSLKHAADSGRPHVYLLSEPKLVRSMRMVGLRIEPIGSYVAHKGLRQPCYIDAQHFMDNLPVQFEQMLERIEQQMPNIMTARAVNA
ncbi:PEP-CTERM/exosortase system-associated acyltransferase [Neptunicella sp. SCSIO 80796]|uniref:PEP-CTERM/exosortase system-associated acyltransferase n=1 Tax=Neptunicella plasticusilytica TaxID=3117012 RepID=UPI003A4D9BA4